MNEQNIKEIYLAIMARSLQEKVRINVEVTKKRIAEIAYLHPESGYDHTRSLRSRKHRLLDPINLDKFLLYIEPMIDALARKREDTIKGVAFETTYHDDSVALFQKVNDELPSIVDIQKDIIVNQGSAYTHREIVDICYTIYTCFHSMGLSYKAAKGYTDKVLRELGATVAPSMIDIYGKAMNHSVPIGTITRLMEGIQFQIEQAFMQEFRKEFRKDHAKVEDANQ